MEIMKEGFPGVKGLGVQPRIHWHLEKITSFFFSHIKLEKSQSGGLSFVHPVSCLDSQSFKVPAQICVDTLGGVRGEWKAIGSWLAVGDVWPGMMVLMDCKGRLQACYLGILEASSGPSQEFYKAHGKF